MLRQVATKNGYTDDIAVCKFCGEKLRFKYSTFHKKLKPYELDSERYHTCSNSGSEVKVIKMEKEELVFTSSHPPKSGTCSACDKSVYWFINGRTGSNIPVDPWKVSPKDTFMGFNYRVHGNHFQHCSKKSSFNDIVANKQAALKEGHLAD